jgi:hypothetical protein
MAIPGDDLADFADAAICRKKRRHNARQIRASWALRFSRPPAPHRVAWLATALSTSNPAWLTRNGLPGNTRRFGSVAETTRSRTAPLKRLELVPAEASWLWHNRKKVSSSR